jgi:thiol-disulfide isomerase/thioredoxin
MDLEGLRTFLVLANTKNYTRAAGQLFVAQSTVTNRIAELERELWVSLFDRTNRKVELTQEGERFRDFAVEYDGKTAHLSDYVGRGKYVLVDFWASWCGPCRAGIPKVIALHEKYKDRNFTALGVAVKDKPEATLRAIKDDAIPYPQILNSQAVASELYGIDAIPELILFAPDGTILVRGNNRMDAIEQKLAEVFPEEDWRPHGQIQSAHPY